MFDSHAARGCKGPSIIKDSGPQKWNEIFQNLTCGSLHEILRIESKHSMIGVYNAQIIFLNKHFFRLAL